MNESMAQMIGGMEKRLMCGVDGVTQEIKKIKKECQSLKLLFFEIEIMQEEMARKGTARATEKQLFKTRIDRTRRIELEEKVRECREPEEESVKPYIEEEVEKRNMAIPEVQQQAEEY